MGFFSDLWDDIKQGVEDVADWATGKDQSDANKQAIKDTNAANIAMARESNAMTQALAQQNFAFQREFAEQGIQKRVEDAKKAGIHPLYAIGAQTPSVSPVGGVFETANQQAPTGSHATGLDLVKQAFGVANTVSNWQQASAYTKSQSAQANLANAQAAEITARMARDAELGYQKHKISSTGIGREIDDRIIKLMLGMGGDTKKGPESSAQDVEDEYGGVVGELHGIGKYFADRSRTNKYNKITYQDEGKIMPDWIWNVVKSAVMR